MPHPKRGKPKVSDIRYSEYYDLQKTFDRLYRQSQGGNNFYGLMNIISSSENIMLAVRTIRSNTGSRTPGTDGRTMKHLLKTNRTIEKMEARTIRRNTQDYERRVS